MDGFPIKLQNLCQIKTARAVLLLIVTIAAIFILQNCLVGIGSSSLSPFSIFGGFPQASKLTYSSTSPPVISSNGSSNNSAATSDGDSSDNFDYGEDHPNINEEFELDLENGTLPRKDKDGDLFMIGKSKGGQESLPSNPSSEFASTIKNVTAKVKHPKPKKEVKQQRAHTISEMNQMLIDNRASPRSMIPRWPAPADRQIIDVRTRIENAPVVRNDPDLYAPAFRNISMFKRSYELMEQILKVYVYTEGDKPIFHNPTFTGLYASEGWFMKHMEGNTHFVTKDPRKAHLFYMPFGSSKLADVYYAINTSYKKKIIDHLHNYVRNISSKYPFWNRTGGADHFFAGCHDWATTESAATMLTSIRALCNSDVHEGFEIGKDVALTETNVVYQNSPLHGLGGKPARERTLLAFFAGQMTGYLRPIILKYWENKDPDMKIIHMMPHYGRTVVKKKRKKMMVNMYADYMKDSKYCICPRGWEVSSPRIVEAIFYECVPVIISDNFVPPFFELMNWEVFSLILPESDVPRLKDVLMSIPWSKYEALQMGVRRVQRHFLWNMKPIRYDLFHMILHNVWFNRVFQLKVD